MTRISATLSLLSCIASIAAGAALAPSKSASTGKHVLSQTVEATQGLKQATEEESVGLEAEFRDMTIEANAQEPFALQKLDIQVYMGISIEEQQYGFNCEIDLSGSGYQELRNCQSLDGGNSASLQMASRDPLPEVIETEAGNGYTLGAPLPLTLSFELNKYGFATGPLEFMIGADDFTYDPSSTETIRFNFTPKNPSTTS